MSVPSYISSDAKHASSQWAEVCWILTADSGALTFNGALKPPAIVVDANGDSTQALVNTLLEVDSAGAALSAASTSELDYATACGATALGTDSFAIIAKIGDVKRVVAASAQMFSGASSATVAEAIASSTTVPPNTLTNYCYATPAGNLFVRFVLTGADAASNKIVVVRAWVELK